METNQLGKGIEYNHTLVQDKHYFAGFLNLAQNNIEAVFGLFCERFGLSKTNALSIINDQFKDDLANSEYQRKLDFLKQYFPVTFYLDLEITNDEFKDTKDKEIAKREYFRDNFKLLINGIKYLRNYYSHYYHEPIDFDKNLFELLDKLFLAVVSDVKKQKMKGDQSRHLFKKQLNSEIKELIELKTTYLENQRKKGKRVNLEPESIENAVFNDAFQHLLYKESVNNNYKSKLDAQDEIENKVNISESGLIFLLSIFLQRRENEQLRANIKGYKAKVIVNTDKPIDRKNNSLKYMATHWVFNHLSVKTIKYRLNTTFYKETLLTQIADELSKVPDELYQTFTEKQKNKFIEDVNEYLKDSEITKSLERSRVVHPVIRKRYEDKFNYFALRFLDEFVDFPTLRFQIHIGNYIHDSRKKTIVGTKYKTERVIKEKINGFGKLSEISSIKADFYKSLDKETAWEMFPNPSYNFVGNNIPIYIDLRKSKVKGAGELFGSLKQLEVQQKTIARKENKPSKKDILNKLSGNIVFGKPTVLFSMNEMQALLYEVLINKKTGAEIEDILIEKLIERHKTITKFNPEDPLPTSQITKKLRKSGKETIIDVEKLLRAIENELFITNEKQSLIEINRKELKDRSNKRRFVFTNKELGQEATWLADDIKRFMPKEIKNNWKGYQHSQLQQFLAFYESKKDEAAHFLMEQWNWKENTYFFNTWLDKTFQKKYFDQFYIEYLKQRKDYFKTLKTQLNGFKQNKKLLKKFFKQYFVWSIFHKRLFKISSTKQQKNELLLKPLVFPRGVFNEKPTYIKGKNLKEDSELYACWYRFILNENHNFQKFYSWERDYKDLFESKKNSSIFTNNKYDLSENEQLNLLKRKQDNKIKKIKGQDLFLNLMIQRILKDLYNQKVKTELVDYYLTQEERIEKQKEAQKQSERAKGDKSENIIKDDFIWSKIVSFKSGQINEPTIQLKDIGKFIQLIKDEKVKRIFEYDTLKTWTKSEIETELENYERIRREEVFKLIQKIEKKVLEKHNFNNENHPESLMLKGNVNFKKYITQGILSKDSSVKEEDVKWIEGLKESSFESIETIKLFQKKPKKVQDAFLLIYIRNKFAHNQLPIKKYYNVMLSKSNNANNVAENILNYIKKLDIF